ncbi:MAG: methyltransferase FkbM family [Bacteroidetes bacterium]|jgi:FkbM family methyltransferase|nr:methyltransferase FkbM family [Bacteroidota bacterium]MDF2452265.1 methyltransferase FkbM family [Bacteroidota bacterium]
MKKIIYSIIETFLRNKGVKTTISGIELRLPVRFYKYYPKDYEGENIAFFRREVKDGDFVIDIGAQLGLMTKIFSDLVGNNGKVFAFEPTPETFHYFLETIAINGLSKNVIPYQKAVADRNTSAFFKVSEHSVDASNSLIPFNDDISNEEVKVDVISIDNFVEANNIPRINFAKIDAEGAEYLVLKGLQRTISRDRPKINLALHPGAVEKFGGSLNEIYDFIVANEYAVIYKSSIISKERFLNIDDLFDVQLLPRE